MEILAAGNMPTVRNIELTFHLNIEIDANQAHRNQPILNKNFNKKPFWSREKKTHYLPRTNAISAQRSAIAIKIFHRPTFDFGSAIEDRLFNYIIFPREKKTNRLLFTIDIVNQIKYCDYLRKRK